MSNKTVHELYHQKTKSVRKVINENNFTYRLLIDSLNQVIIKKKLNILDIGCGAGTLALYLSSKGHNVTGIDISTQAIKACKVSAKNLNLNTKFYNKDFMSNDLKEKYDLVIFSEVIEHLPDDKKALKKIYKLLKPAGILLLSTPSIKAPLHRLGLTRKFDTEVGHLRRYTKFSISKLIRDSDLKIITIRQTEGILRNFLYVNPVASKYIRFIKYFVSDFVTQVDNILVKLFGESNFIIIATKK